MPDKPITDEELILSFETSCDKIQEALVALKELESKPLKFMFGESNGWNE